MLNWHLDMRSPRSSIRTILCGYHLPCNASRPHPLLRDYSFTGDFLVLIMVNRSSSALIWPVAAGNGLVACSNGHPACLVLIRPSGLFSLVLARSACNRRPAGHVCSKHLLHKVGWRVLISTAQTFILYMHPQLPYWSSRGAIPRPLV